MRPTENIKRFIRNARIKTNPDVNEAVLKSLLSELDKTKDEFSIFLQPSVWRIIMKSKITKLAAAAVLIIIAAVLGTHHFGGSIDVATPAFANVIGYLQTHS